MPITVIVGEQRGDEGKGKYTDKLAEYHDIVARFGGANNAGHTVITPDGDEFDLHMLPSGITHPHIVNLIGRGALVNAHALVEEIEKVGDKGISVTGRNLKIDSKAHLILPHHIEEDRIREAGSGSQGSTKLGIAYAGGEKYQRVGPTAETIKHAPDKVYEIARDGLRELASKRNVALARQIAAGVPENELLQPVDPVAKANEYVKEATRISEYITDVTYYLFEQLTKTPPAKVLAEGAQAFWLDIDNGMYPYVTSSSTTSGGVPNGLGVPLSQITDVIGVVKAIQSHVGEGPMVTEIPPETELFKRLHGDMSAPDAERGTTTGRTRRLGHLDIPALRRATWINDTRYLAITKLDWLNRYGNEPIPLCIGYRRKNKILDMAPDSARKLWECRPEYLHFEGSSEDIREIREFGDLPRPYQDWIRGVEKYSRLPVAFVGVGPRRNQVIDRRKELGLF